MKIENGLTATFDGWTNVKQENIEWSCTEDVMWHIEQLMNDAKNKKVKINAFVSDSAEEYVAAR